MCASVITQYLSPFLWVWWEYEILGSYCLEKCPNMEFLTNTTASILLLQGYTYTVYTTQGWSGLLCCSGWNYYVLWYFVVGERKGLDRIDSSSIKVCVCPSLSSSQGRIGLQGLSLHPIYSAPSWSKGFQHHTTTHPWTKAYNYIGGHYIGSVREPMTYENKYCAPL